MFESNRGQIDPQVKFLARNASAYKTYFTPDTVVHVIPTTLSVTTVPESALSPGQDPRREFAVIRMRFIDVDPLSELIGQDELPGTVHYFIGNNPSQWHTNVPTYHRVTYSHLYPGIDVTFYGTTEGRFEHDFEIAPGADPARITLAFEGADSLVVDLHGDLIVHGPGTDLVLHKPVAYQDAAGNKSLVAVSYMLKEDGHVEFLIPAFNPSFPLIIDPIVSYSTYLGGEGDDFGTGLAVDTDGNAYVAGWTDSLFFPTTTGVVQSTGSAGLNAFVTKLTAAGSSLVYSTYLGGTGKEFEVIGLATDQARNVYVTGITESSDFPVTANAYQKTHKGATDVFVTKLDPTGSKLVYSTLLGGSSADGSQSIALDQFGNAYVAGFTYSANFPVTATGLQRTLRGNSDAFVTKLNAAGSGLIYSSYLGGTGDEFPPGLTIDPAGNAYITGSTTSKDFPTTSGVVQKLSAGNTDAFVAKINPTGSALVFATYLGGLLDDVGRDIALDPAGSVYVVGITESSGFPVTAGAFQTVFRGFSDLFIAKLNPSATTLLYSTFLGGGGPDTSRKLTVDSLGRAIVTGATNSPDFPVTTTATQKKYASGEDTFLTALDPFGQTLNFSTFLGGDGNDRGRNLAVNLAGDIYVTGFTNSTNFPTVSPWQNAYAGGVGPCFFSGGCDAFVTKFSLVHPISLRLSSTITSALAGDWVAITIMFSNATAQPQQVGFQLVLESPSGQEFPIMPMEPIGFPPNTTVTMQATVPIPPMAPNGQWMIKGVLVRPSSAGTPELIDHSRLALTVGP